MVEEKPKKELGQAHINSKTNSGLKINDGRIYEEYLAALTRPVNFYPVYDKMRRSDYQIKRMLNVLISPIKSGSFRYTAENENDTEEVKQASFKNKCLKEWPSQNWSRMLQEMLSYLPIGFAVFEPFGHVVDDKELGKVITLKNLGFMKQSSVDQWDIKDGDVMRVHQEVTAGQNLVDAWIDGKDLMILTNEQEGDNFEGISVLRAVYGNYIRKELYLKLDMIGLEKMSVGTPIFYLPNQMMNDEKELAAVQEVGEAYTSHEDAYVILSDKLKDGGFEIEKGEYNSEAVDTSIKREDMGILDSILAGFLAIGTQKSGGNAQNEGQMEMFLNSLLFIANYIAENLDALAHKYYVLNFGEPEKRSTLHISGIARKDARAIMEIVRGYVTSKVIQPDDVLETRVREELNLPKIDPDTVRDINASPDYEEDQDDDDQTNPDKQDAPSEAPEEGED